MITSIKPSLPVVTLSINDNIKFLENIKQRFKRTISWNKYRSEITTQPKINDLDYLIYPAFRNVNKLFVLSLKNGKDGPTKNSFDKYYMLLVEIKDFDALIDNKPFFDQSVKTNKRHMKNVLKCQEIMNSLDYLYHQKYYILIGKDLSRQKNTCISKQISFVGKLEEDDGATMFFIA